MPRLSRQANHKLERILIYALAGNAVFGFFAYFQARGRESEKRAAYEQRLDAARDAVQRRAALEDDRE